MEECFVALRNIVGFHRLLGKSQLQSWESVFPHALRYISAKQAFYQLEQVFLWFCICFCSVKVHLGIYFPLQQQVALNSTCYSHTHNHFVLHVVKPPLPKEIIHKRNSTSFYRCSRLSTRQRWGSNSSNFNHTGK